MLLVAILLAAMAALVVKLARADGDLTLLSKGPAKREEVEDKVIWITGASRGIGEVLARQFAAMGAKLILSARNEAELERVRSRLAGKHAPDGVVILPLDLASGERQLGEAVEKAEACFSGAGVDYMIHNAAHQRPKVSALEETDEQFQLSSAAGKVPAPGQAMYSASKSALNGYFHTLRSEGNPLVGT